MVNMCPEYDEYKLDEYQNNNNLVKRHECGSDKK